MFKMLKTLKTLKTIPTVDEDHVDPSSTEGWHDHCDVCGDEIRHKSCSCGEGS